MKRGAPPRQLETVGGPPLGVVDKAAQILGGHALHRASKELHAPEIAHHLGSLDGTISEDAGFLENRVSDRADMRVDALEVTDQVEVQRRGFDALHRVAGKALDMRFRVADALPVLQTIRVRLAAANSLERSTTGGFAWAIIV